MKNYIRLKKSYADDIKLCREYFSDLISELCNDLSISQHHYWEPVTDKIISLGKKLEIYNDISNTNYSFDHVNLFVCKPNKLGGLHIDDASNPRFCSLNIPLLENDTSRMIWVDPTQYSLAEADYRNGYRAGYPRHDLTLNYDNWKIIDDVDFSMPMLIRVNHWHTVDNRYNPKPRVALAFRFRMNPTFENLSSELDRLGLVAEAGFEPAVLGL